MTSRKRHRASRAAAPGVALIAALALPCALEAACADIYVFELEKRLARGDAALVDVREPHEYGDCRIPGSINIPASTLSNKTDGIEGKKAVIVYCASGRRSENACAMLEGRGLDVYNLVGGIKAYYNTGRDLDGRCLGAPGFRYGKGGRPAPRDVALPPPEPEIKGCK